MVTKSMAGFEWEADYEALCSSYGFSVSLGLHGKELKATAPAVPGQILLIESPIVAWPVRASADFDAFVCCENCLKIKPFYQERADRHPQKVRRDPDATPHIAEQASAAQISTPSGAQPHDSTPEGTRVEYNEEEESGVCVHDQHGNVLWFCSRRCHQQVLGVTFSAAISSDAATGDASEDREIVSLASRKRDTYGYVKEVSSSDTQPTGCITTNRSSNSFGRRRVFGWQEFLSAGALHMLRLHDQQFRTHNHDLPVEEDAGNPIGFEALGRVIARVAATAASLHNIKGLGLEDAYAEACRPFLRFAAAEAEEAHAAFDMELANVRLQQAIGPSIAAVLGTDVAATLLGRNALAFFYGVLMRNAQSLLIWGATQEGTLMVLRAAGLYVLQSCCNHSCVPNCCVDNGADACISLRAERAIAPGEELTITYIPLSLPQGRRQELLNSYRFICDCSRCLEEKQQQS